MVRVAILFIQLLHHFPRTEFSLFDVALSSGSIFKVFDSTFIIMLEFKGRVGRFIFSSSENLNGVSILMATRNDSGEDYYKVLGIPKQASTKDIHAAFRREAKRYHPDVCHMSYCEKMFKKVVDAYRTLKDDKKRALHNKELIAQYFLHHVSEPAKERLKHMPYMDINTENDEWGWRVG